MLFRLTICLQLILLNFAISQGQSQINEDSYTRFLHITTSEGLSHPKVNDIHQDARGFIWIGTEDGLNRYDGYRLMVYKSQEADSNSISDNTITSIASDSVGNLWIGTKNGLNFYNSRTGKFSRLFSSFSNINTLRSNHIRRLVWFKNLLWIETLDGTLSTYEPKQKKFNHFHHHLIHQPYYRYHALYPDDTVIWFGGRGIGINFLNLKNNNITHIPANPNSQKGNAITI